LKSSSSSCMTGSRMKIAPSDEIISAAHSAIDSGSSAIEGLSNKLRFDSGSSAIEGLSNKLRFRVNVPKQPPLVLWKLCTQPVTVCVVAPKDYFAASNELTAIALVVCWTITMAVDWRKAWDHPARRYVGHLNPCFGWDFPPASYFAVCFAGVDVFLAFRYATLEAMRTRLLDHDNRISWAERFSLFTSYMHAAAAVGWLLLWSVGPPDGNWLVHLIIFSTCVMLRYLCTLGNYIESRFGDARQRLRVTRKHTIFIAFYGVVTGILPILYFTDVVIYRKEHRSGVDPPIPWPVVFTFDMLWCLCLGLVTRTSVPEPPIQITRKILQFDEEYEVDEQTAMLGFRGHKGQDHRKMMGVSIDMD